MAQNVEIKAKIEADSFELLVQRAAAMATSGPVDLIQTDSFFNTPNGRLKLREFDDGTAELIAYERPNQDGPKTSTYTRASCDGPAMLTALTRSLGLIGVVKKKRKVYFVDQTRIHLDQVAGLGAFLELEVVLAPPATQETGNSGQEARPMSEQIGQQIASSIMRKLEISETSLISVAYIDLLQQVST